MTLTMISRSKIAITALIALVIAVGAYGSSFASSSAVALNEKAPAQVSSTASPEKLGLAKQYIASVPVESDIRAAVDAMAQNAAPDQRVLIKSIADKTIDYNRLRTAAELNAADLFTEAELKAMIKFYSTPEGQSIRTKMPQYEASLQPVVVEVLQAFVMRLKDSNISIPNGQ